MKYISVTLSMTNLSKNFDGFIYEENVYFSKKGLPVFINWLYILSMEKKKKSDFLSIELDPEN